MVELGSRAPFADADEALAPYYAELAAAFIRDRLGLSAAMPAAAMPTATLMAQARAAGLRLHKFERGPLLPRVRAVIGALRGLAPVDLLDIGSGRGAFLWPLLDAWPDLPVTALERDPQRSADLEAVRRGGVERLTPIRADVTRAPLADQSVDVVTMLEVLEHLDRPELAAREVVRVARRAVIVSVPSKPDNNPGHIHRFTATTLTDLLIGAGARRARIDGVLGHLIAIATLTAR